MVVRAQIPTVGMALGRLLSPDESRHSDRAVNPLPEEWFEHQNERWANRDRGQHRSLWGYMAARRLRLRRACGGGVWELTEPQERAVFLAAGSIAGPRGGRWRCTLVLNGSLRDDLAAAAGVLGMTTACRVIAARCARDQGTMARTGRSPDDHEAAHFAGHGSAHRAPALSLDETHRRSGSRPRIGASSTYAR